MVSAPPWTSEQEIEAVLHGHARWILAKLRSWNERQSMSPSLIFEDGATSLWLGQALPIRRVPGMLAIPRAVQPDQSLESIPLAEDCEDPQSALIAWYAAQALPWFRRRTQVFAERLGQAPRELRLSNARGRWGSCTRKGVIRLNWRLMQASPAEIDYVVAHEVAHLAEMNHGPAFWETVARLYPEWRGASDLLDARDALYRRI